MLNGRSLVRNREKKRMGEREFLIYTFNNFSMCACVVISFTHKKMNLLSVQDAIILFATIPERQTFEYV